MKNKVILLFIILLWLLTICMFSNQNGTNSLKLSDNVTLKIVNVYDRLFKKDYSLKEKEKIVKNLRFFVRKTAHFIEYLILGLLISKFLKCYNIKHIILVSFFISFLLASFDEVHQIFIAKRTPKVLDVFIDEAGAFLGIMLSCHFSKNKVGKIN